VLMPMTANSDVPERLLGVAQVTSDAMPLLGRSVTFESLVTSSFVREAECAVSELPPVPIRAARRSRTSRRAHLKLVVSQAQPAPGHDQLRFNGNGALATLQARCEAEADKTGRFRT
jgi:hypothetical protein